MCFAKTKQSPNIKWSHDGMFYCFNILLSLLNALSLINAQSLINAKSLLNAHFILNAQPLLNAQSISNAHSLLNAISDQRSVSIKRPVYIKCLVSIKRPLSDKRLVSKHLKRIEFETCLLQNSISSSFILIDCRNLIYSSELNLCSSFAWSIFSSFTHRYIPDRWLDNQT